MESSISSNAESIRNGVRRAAANALKVPLREYVSERAEVLFVDDDSSVCAGTLRYFGHGAIATLLDTNDAVRAVDLITGVVDGTFGEFASLMAHCEKVIAHAAMRRRPVIVVTDILLDHAGWAGADAYRTGIDVISELRRGERRLDRHTGIVAFTGATSPFVTMSAFLRGADSVVFKGDSPLAYNHADLDPTGTGLDKLLLTLAFLCFQKEFLREKRQASQKDAYAQIAHLDRVLPDYAISAHLHAEWADTRYVLNSRATYPVRQAPPEVHDEIGAILKRYDG
jgi:CheY-like chemotaxis protein